MSCTDALIGHRSIFELHRQLFRGGFGPVRRRHQSNCQITPYAPQVWSHKFYCLSNKCCTSPPQSRQQRQPLVACGLGEKVFTLGLHSSAAELHQVILNTFLKLSACGGYELLRCQVGSKELNLIEPPYTPVNLCSVIGQSRVSICPLQTNIHIPLRIQSSPDQVC